MTGFSKKLDALFAQLQCAADDQRGTSAECRAQFLKVLSDSGGKLSDEECDMIVHRLDSWQLLFPDWPSFLKDIRRELGVPIPHPQSAEILRAEKNARHGSLPQSPAVRRPSPTQRDDRTPIGIFWNAAKFDGLQGSLAQLAHLNIPEPPEN